MVGKQVVNKENGRSDLTAVDENGNVVLIEIKRDALDIIQRKEAFEFQSIMYAASYAKIKTSEDLVDKIFASYIEKYKDEFELGDLTAYEKASRILNDFLEKNNVLKIFNSKQRIILIASSFDKQTLSAAAWLIANEVDISCFELSPMKIEDNYFIDINRILSPLALEDFYVDFKGEKLTFNKWGQKVTGWSSIRIYDWAMIKGRDKTLHEMRQKKMILIEDETE